MVSCTLHGSMHNAYIYAQCIEACTLRGSMHNAWKHAQCMEACTMYGSMHNAWKHATDDQCSILTHGKIYSRKNFMVQAPEANVIKPFFIIDLGGK